MLTGCDSMLQENLDVNPDLSGELRLSVVIDPTVTSNMPSAAAINASVRRHMPAVLTIKNGLGAGTDGYNDMHFSMKFASPDDYRKKVAQLLRASGSSIVPRVTMAVTKWNPDHSQFSKTLSISENFTVKDLMAWLPAGLLADGVITKAQAAQIAQVSSRSVVQFGGVLVSNGSSIDLTVVADHGFTVTDDIKLGGDTFTSTITYELYAKYYAADKATYDAFLAKATPAGATLAVGTDGGGNPKWTLTFESRSVDELVAMTEQAMGGGYAFFRYDSGPVTSTMQTMTTFTGDIICDDICDSARTPKVTVTVPSEWVVLQGGTLSRVGDDGTSTYELSSRPLSSDVTFITQPTLDEVAADVTLNDDGTATQTIKYWITNADAAVLGEDWSKVLAPAGSDWTFTRQQDGDRVVYVATTTAPSMSDLSDRLALYLRGSKVTFKAADTKSSYQDDVAVVLDLSRRVALPPTKGITLTLNLPAPLQPRSLTVNSGPVRSSTYMSQRGPATQSTQTLSLAVTATAPKPTGRAAIIVWSIVAAVVLAAAFVLFRLRNRIAALWRSHRSRVAVGDQAEPVVDAPEDAASGEPGEPPTDGDAATPVDDQAPDGFFARPPQEAPPGAPPEKQA